MSADSVHAVSRSFYRRMPFAIVGMACRFPGAEDVPAFWRLLREERDAVTDVPRSRYDVDALYDPDPMVPGKTMSRWGGFLEQKLDEFDPLAFGIAPREAIELDPQQRLALEVTREAMDAAGAARLRGTRTGVFMGALFEEYASVGAGDLAGIGGQRLIGHTLDMIAHRLSFVFGLEGPSMTVATGCSSSLVALQIACMSLWYGESERAIVGAVGALVDPGTQIGMSKAGALSPDGRCKTFDARANGYVRSEGCGILVVKTLAQALRDGDPIRAVIRGTWTNNNGAGQVLMRPSSAAQATMLRNAYDRAGIDPARVHYVEMHGTGTPIGDPTEAAALGAVMGCGRPVDRPLLVGSVKTNLGHLEAAAGVAGVIKTVLAMEQREIPANLHYVTPNPAIDLAAARLRVVSARTPWPAHDEPALAGVSSFGWGGTNGHVVLEESPASPVVTLGYAAASERDARTRAAALALHAEAALTLGDVEAALVRDRGAGPYRVGFVARSCEEARARLGAFARGETVEGLWHGLAQAAPRVGFACGSSRELRGAALRLFATEPVFAEVLRGCDAEVLSQAGASLLDVLLASAGSDERTAEEPGVATVLDVAIAIALAEQLRAFGVTPVAVAGGPRFELAAACIAGCIDRADALRLARHVGRAAAEGVSAATYVVRASGLGLRDDAHTDLAARFGDVKVRAGRTAWVGDEGRACDAMGLDAEGLARVVAKCVAASPAGTSNAATSLAAFGCDVVLALGDIAPVGGARVVPTLGREGDGRTAFYASVAELFALGAARARAGDDAHGPIARALVLSAQRPAALQAFAERTARWIEAHPEQAIDDVCFTAAVRRDVADHRLAIVASTREDFVGALRAVGRGESHPAAVVGARPLTPRRVLAVFPGHGSQWRGMGRMLLRTEPTFARAIDSCEAAIQREVGWSLRAALGANAVAETETEAETEDRLWGRIDVVQPAIFAIQVALAALWRHRGLVPDAIVGHSLGEAAAAFVAGALSLEDAVKVICHRSRLAERTRGQGGMALVELTAEEAARFIEPWSGRLCVAVCNSPRSTVVSGEPSAVEEVLRAAEARGIFCRRVKVAFASHSAQMDPVVPDLVAALSPIRPRAARVPLYSSVHARPIEGLDLTPSYWGRNLRDAVLFAQTLRRAVADGYDTVVEISPHPILVIPAREVLADVARDGAGGASGASGASGLVVSSLKRDEDEQKSLLDAAAQLHVAGVALDWRAMQPTGRVVALPAYPWQRQRYWRSPSGAARRLGAWASEHPLLEVMVTVADGTRVLEGEIDGERPPFVRELHVDGARVLPVSMHLEAALAVARVGSGAASIQDVELGEAMPIADAPVRLQASLSNDTATIHVATAPSGTVETSWSVRARALASRRAAAGAGVGGTGEERVVIADVVARCPKRTSGAEHYARLEAFGVTCGPSLRAIEQTFASDVEAIARLAPPKDAAHDARYVIHPSIAEAALQTLTGLLGEHADGRRSFVVPTRVASAEVVRLDAHGTLWVHARRDPSDALRGEIRILSDGGEVLATFSGVACRTVADAAAVTEDPAVLSAAWREASAEATADAPAGAAKGQWLIFGDESGIAAALAQKLEGLGGEVLFDRGPHHALAHDALGRELEATLRAAFPAGGTPRGVVSLVAVDALSVASLATHTRALVLAVRRLASTELPHVWLVSRGAEATSARDACSPNSVVQSAMWGLARSLSHEAPDVATTRVDLAANASNESVDALVGELLRGRDDEEVALRENVRFVSSVGVAQIPSATETGVVAVPIAECDGGVQLLSDGRIVPTRSTATSKGAASQAAGEREVVIAVTHASLAPRCGAEALEHGFGACAGRVLSVGSGVRHVHVGDPVVALIGGMRGTLATAPAALVLRVRPELDAARAVALLPLLSTALHAVRTADVGPGTRVLVHRASSPLGAALAFASRMAGAEVIAAYADPGHRAALERLATVTHDGSRPLVDAVLEATHGAGVDVAFALGASSEMVPALAVEGQIVTFAGETDGLSLPVAELARRRISVQALHVEGVRAERPEAIARVLTSAVDMLARGDALPLAHEVVPLSRASTVLGGAAHDKVVAVSFDDPRAVVRLPQSEAQRAASAPEGAVSVLVADPSPLADWVHGLLDNAHGPTPAAGASRPRVVVASASDARDALRRGALAAWLGDALPHGVTLQTVAFVLAADEMTPADAFAAPAIDVATELHAFAADRSARAIVSFGTLASVLGELGHAGAALVGAALDALATRSRARGLPAAHIALGSLEHGASLGPSRGVRPLPAERAEALVRRVLAAIGAGEADFARALAIADVDGRQWTEARPQVSGSRFLARLARSQKSESPRAEGGAPALRDALRDASGEARIVLLEDYIAEQTSLVLRLPPSDLDRAAPLKTYGVDSVTALEIRNRLEGALGMRLTATLLWTYPTVEALAAHLATKVASVPSDAPTPGGALAASHTVEPRENRAPSPDPAEHVPSDEAELEAALRAVESLLD